MARPNWNRIVLALIAVLGLGGGMTWMLRAQAPSEVPDRHITVGVDGQKLRCKVVQTWTPADGGQAYQVQVIDSGELITVVRDGRADAAGKELPARVYRWLNAKSSPPGAPVPPAARVVTAGASSPGMTSKILTWDDVAKQAPKSAQSSSQKTVSAPTVIETAPTLASAPPPVIINGQCSECPPVSPGGPRFPAAAAPRVETPETTTLRDRIKSMMNLPPASAATNSNPATVCPSETLVIASGQPLSNPVVHPVVSVESAKPTSVKPTAPAKHPINEQGFSTSVDSLGQAPWAKGNPGVVLPGKGTLDLPVRLDGAGKPEASTPPVTPVVGRKPTDVAEPMQLTVPRPLPMPQVTPADASTKAPAPLPKLDPVEPAPKLMPKEDVNAKIAPTPMIQVAPIEAPPVKPVVPETVKAPELPKEPALPIAAPPAPAAKEIAKPAPHPIVLPTRDSTKTPAAIPTSLGNADDKSANGGIAAPAAVSIAPPPALPGVGSIKPGITVVKETIIELPCDPETAPKNCEKTTACDPKGAVACEKGECATGVCDTKGKSASKLEEKATIFSHMFKSKSKTKESATDCDDAPKKDCDAPAACEVKAAASGKASAKSHSIVDWLKTIGQKEKSASAETCETGACSPKAGVGCASGACSTGLCSPGTTMIGAGVVGPVTVSRVVGDKSSILQRLKNKFSSHGSHGMPGTVEMPCGALPQGAIPVGAMPGSFVPAGPHEMSMRTHVPNAAGFDRSAVAITPGMIAKNAGRTSVDLLKPIPGTADRSRPSIAIPDMRATTLPFPNQPVVQASGEIVTPVDAVPNVGFDRSPTVIGQSGKSADDHPAMPKLADLPPTIKADHPAMPKAKDMTTRTDIPHPAMPNMAHVPDRTKTSTSPTSLAAKHTPSWKQGTIDPRLFNAPSLPQPAMETAKNDRPRAEDRSRSSTDPLKGLFYRDMPKQPAPEPRMPSSNVVQVHPAMLPRPPIAYGYPMPQLPVLPMASAQPIQQTSYSSPSSPMVMANPAMDRPASSAPASSGDPRVLAQTVQTAKESPHPSQRELAVMSLANFDHRANPQLIGLLNHIAVTDPAGAVRASAVTTMVRMNIPASAMYNTLQALRGDADVRVRHAVEEASTAP